MDRAEKGTKIAAFILAAMETSNEPAEALASVTLALDKYADSHNYDAVLMAVGIVEALANKRERDKDREEIEDAEC